MNKPLYEEIKCFTDAMTRMLKNNNSCIKESAHENMRLAYNYPVNGVDKRKYSGVDILRVSRLVELIQYLNEHKKRDNVKDFLYFLFSSTLTTVLQWHHLQRAKPIKEVIPKEIRYLSSLYLHTPDFTRFIEELPAMLYEQFHVLHFLTKHQLANQPITSFHPLTYGHMMVILTTYVPFSEYFP